MSSSPGFVSHPCDCGALFRLAFAAAPGVTPLASPQRWTRQLPAGLACPAVLRIPAEVGLAFIYGTGTLYGWLFNTIRLATRLVTPYAGPTTPARQARLVW